MNADREAVISIMNFLKNTREFFTISQLESATGIEIPKGSNLMALLQKHSHIIWRKEKLRFKVAFTFKNSEGFLEFLQDQPENAVVENDELRRSYENFSSDLERLHKQRKVFVIDAETNKRSREDKVIYLNTMPDIPLASSELRELWSGLEAVKKDMTELRNFITDREFKLADLSLDVQLMLQGKKKAKARQQGRKREKKRKANAQLDGIDFSALKSGPSSEMTTGDDGDKEEGDVQYEQLTANQHLKNFVRRFVRLLYNDDKFLVLMDAIINSDPKNCKAGVLADRLHLSAPLTRKILVQMRDEKLLRQILGNDQMDDNSKWLVCFRQFIDAASFRFMAIEELLKKEVSELTTQVQYSCPGCKKVFFKNDMGSLFENNGICTACQRTKVEKAASTSTGRALDKTAVTREMQKYRAELMEINLEDPSKILQSETITVTKGEDGQKKTIKVVESVDSKTLYQISSKGELILPVLTHEAEEWGRGTQLAHDFLNLVAELKLYYSRVLVFEITKHSLYFARNRGLTPDYILQMLATLTLDRIPASLSRLIRDEDYLRYYQATIVLKPIQIDSRTVWRYWLESAERDLLNQFAAYAHPESSTIYMDDKQVPPVFRFQLDENKRVQLKQAAAAQGCNIIEEFDYLHDKTADRLENKNGPIFLKDKSTREYQNRSAHKLFWDGKVHSGILVMPCGSGKTLTGIAVCSIVRRSVLIFVTSVMAGHQWKKEFERWTNIDPKLVSVFTNDAKKTGGWNPNAKIVISTYNMFSTSDKRAADSQRMIESARKRVCICFSNQKIWGVMILDEVHLCPAQIFRTVATKFNAHVKLGLTATMVREDDLVNDVQYLVGPIIHELDTLDLRMRRYIAPVYCSEVVVPLTDQFQNAYDRASSAQEKRLISVCNPNKARVVQELINKHVSEGRKCLIFSEDLFGLEWFSKILTGDANSFIAGDTTDKERQDKLNKFLGTKEGSFILLSSVGDHSIDLPQAEVVIQVAIVNGSRMQEAQRIGRVQRIAAGKSAAWFFSLLSARTDEVKYGENRRLFMEQHGYRYELVETEEDDGMLTETTRDRFLNPKLQSDILGAISKEIKDRTTAGEEKQMLLQNKRLAAEDPVVPPQPKRKKLKGDVLSRLSKKIKYKTGD